VKIYEVGIGKSPGPAGGVVRQVRGLATSPEEAVERARFLIALGECLVYVKPLYELDW
jgi:hypothetical protein